MTITAPLLWLLAWGALGVVLPLLLVVDAALYPDERWRLLGRNRCAWLLTLGLTGLIGWGFVPAIAYLVLARPELALGSREGLEGRRRRTIALLALGGVALASMVVLAFTSCLIGGCLCWCRR